ncbi:MAG: hypothetical protein KKF16_03610 [Euryarchaeota archaeon]|nr:hypothetical protein [Euryarchaeota archaeon]MBV1728919.1 hypothetical protein [Methanobacterium sp.]MBU4548058.1 hypothetical protein [Euryarchaeota archaeon]MBU4608239.1 hypothetical protein [Euryarchaeota archaeon]MBV1755244.1 hypothetical protein [Methanobacterium sp.]
MEPELLAYAGIKIGTLIIEIINIGLLSVLLYLYIKSYNQIKIGFTIGLILFALLLLIRSFITIGFMIAHTDLLMARPIYIGGIMQIIALTILLKVAWDY